MPLRNRQFAAHFTAWNTTDQAGEDGDAANITLRLVQDSGTILTPGGAINEVDAINFPGLYWILLTAAEMDAQMLSLGGVSSTDNVKIITSHFVTQILLTPADIRTQVVEQFNIDTYGEPLAGQPPAVATPMEMITQLYHTLVVDRMDYDVIEGFQNIYMSDGRTIRYRKRVRVDGSNVIRDPGEASG